MFRVARDLRPFSAAHRLNKEYQGKCKHLHGHTYTGRVVIEAMELDHFDFVIDFGDIKRLLDDWVQQHWDHVTLVSEMDHSLLAFLQSEQQDYFVIPGQRNTTSEALAEFLFEKFNQLLKQQPQTAALRLVSVQISESTHSHAEYVAL